MKQKLLIFLFLILLVTLLVGLNAASYVQKQKVPDNEVLPNRSSFNPGTTGTQAFYTLLNESGRKTVRWQQPPAELLTAGDRTPAVFVVVGRVKRQFEPVEVEELLRWVSNGGRLVVIDREPPEGLLTTTANWTLKADTPEDPWLYTVDPSNKDELIGETPAVKPIQPSPLTHSINAVQPSRFASSITFARFFDNSAEPPPPPAVEEPEALEFQEEDEPAANYDEQGFFNMPSPTPLQPADLNEYDVATPSQIAPLVHFASAEKNLVVDVPFGNGRIVYLSDPFIVSNVGIASVDNAQLGINLVAAGNGVIAFDEYHQGFGSDNNRFLQFFEGTPVIAIFLQAAVLVGLVFFSQSRRFARPVPEPEPDRLSKLEYVAAMAEIQTRTRAYDLAIENIYNDFRRRVTRYLGLDNMAVKSNEIARDIAERAGLDQQEVAATLFKCEEIIRGEPTSKKEVLNLASSLRSYEGKLGLTRAPKTRI